MQNSKSNSFEIFEIFEYPSIKIGKQYKKIFWTVTMFGWGSIILSLGIISLPIIPRAHLPLILFVISFPLLAGVIVYYYMSIRKRMICPVCSEGKLELQSLEAKVGEKLIFFCPIGHLAKLGVMSFGRKTRANLGLERRQ